MTVKYVDIFSPEMAEHPAAYALLTQRNLPLPLIAINDEPRFAGGMAVDVISQALEADGLVKPAEPAGN